jgi:hypothetical protein
MRKTKSDVRHPSSFSTGNIQYANAPFRASCVEKQVARATPTSCIAGFVYVEVRYVTYERVRKEGECETEEGEEKETVELGGHNCVCREKVVDLRKKKVLFDWLGRLGSLRAKEDYSFPRSKKSLQSEVPRLSQPAVHKQIWERHA